MKHLGVPLARRQLRLIDCSDITDQLNTSLAKWKTSKLPYDGRFQLAQWVLYKRINYCLQGLHLPKGVLDCVRKIIYAFLWGGRKGISWRQMSKKRTNKGMGLNDI